MEVLAKTALPSVLPAQVLLILNALVALRTLVSPQEPVHAIMDSTTTTESVQHVTICAMDAQAVGAPTAQLVQIASSVLKVPLQLVYRVVPPTPLIGFASVGWLTNPRM